MCGIFVIISSSKEIFKTFDWVRLMRRGPNGHGFITGCLCSALTQHSQHRELGYNSFTDLSASLQQKLESIPLCDSCCLSSLFFASVLNMRSITIQPIANNNGDILLWNGEIFNDDHCSDSAINDGEYLMQSLSQCSSHTEILKIFSQLKGPWAFIYWQKSSRSLWFGRDALGRRSLLLSSSDEFISFSSVAVEPLESRIIFVIENPKTMVIHIHWIENFQSGVLQDEKNGIKCSSVNLQNSACFKKKYLTFFIQIQVNWTEVPAAGIYNITFNTTEASSADTLNSASHVTLYPWIILSHDLITSDSACPSLCQSGCFSLTDFNEEMKDSVKVKNTKLQELFGSISVTINDTAVIAPFSSITELIDHVDNSILEVPEHAASHSAENFAQICKSAESLDINQRTSNNSASNIVHNERNLESNICDDTKPEIYKYVNSNHITASDELIKHLSEAVRVRVTNQSLLCSNCFINKLSRTVSRKEIDCSDFSPHSSSQIENRDVNDCCHASVAVLFSGGVDSLTLACLTDRHVPRSQPIDLLNVAFEQQQQNKTTKDFKKKSARCDFNMTSSYEVPDRVTGRQGVEELRSICPDRIWNFVEINITQKKLQEVRRSNIQNLIKPLNTVLDDSIGCALWFAAEGLGIVDRGDAVNGLEYHSPARVVLVGSGADEQLAGYSRHRVKFQTGDWQGLISEVQMEMERISCRNLGRDDRIVSDHGREARFPFLDESFISFLSSLPMSIKANLTLRRGIGEKFLLRLSAVRLGLHRGAVLPKRAIQFGSRIAKLENKNEKAGDICIRNVEDLE